MTLIGKKNQRSRNTWSGITESKSVTEATRTEDRQIRDMMEQKVMLDRKIIIT